MLIGCETLAALAQATQPACERGFYAAHVAAAGAGTVCFIAAAAAAWRYLRKHKHLRRKDPDAIAAGGPSLAWLNRFVRRMVYLGFALLTAAIFTGMFHAFQPGRAGWFHIWQTHPKLLATAAAWLTYAVALWAARGRKFRARQAAMLSIAGLVLVIVTLLISVLVPD